MAQANPRTVPTRRLYARAFREVRSYWSHLGLILGIELAWLPVALLIPLPVKLIVDSVLGDQPVPGFMAALLPAPVVSNPEFLLHVAVGLGVVLALLTAAHGFGGWLLRDWVAERMVLDFRGRMLLHGLSLPPTAHDRGSHDPALRINNDAPALQWTALYGVIPMVVAAISLAGMLSVVSAISVRLALVALATSVPLIGLIHLHQIRLRDRWHEVRERESAALAVVQETLGHARLVTTFGQERRETARFVTTARDGLRARLGVIRTEGLLGVVLGLSTALGTTTILYMGVHDVQHAIMSMGDLLLIIGYVGQLYQPLQQIGTHITGQQRALVSAERAFAVMDATPAVTERPNARPLGQAIGDIAFEQAGFAYDGRHPVLSGVAMAVPAGACVGVVGRTGAGKTTLINLLIRQFDPTAGRILLDGVDLRDWRLADLRRQFAVVSQEPVLFSTTIRDNIAYADPTASFDRIVAAARQAHAHDFIMRLPDGYDTRVGDRGMRLSGGERQRIALARAFLADAPILILDEPTSAIDLTTEAEIIDSMERLMSGRTTFMVAHRLSTLRRADFIVRVEGGRAVLQPGVGDLLKAS